LRGIADAVAYAARIRSRRVWLDDGWSMSAQRHSVTPAQVTGLSDHDINSVPDLKTGLALLPVQR